MEHLLGKSERVRVPPNSDLVQRDPNNNLSSSTTSTVAVQHVTSGRDKDVVTNVKSVRTNRELDGQGGVGSATNNTYSNEGYNHNSSAKASLGTCPGKSYYFQPPKSIYSEPTVQSEPARRHPHHHRQQHHHHHPHQHRNHRRKRSKSSARDTHQHFGYEIRNVEEFLSKVRRSRRIHRITESMLIAFVELLVIARQHPRRSVIREYFIPNPSGTPDRNSPATGNGGEWGVQDPAVAVRPNSTRRGGLRCVRVLSSAGHSTSGPVSRIRVYF